VLHGPVGKAFPSSRGIGRLRLSIFARIVELCRRRRIFPLVARREETLRAAGVANVADLGDDIDRPGRVLWQSLAAAEAPPLFKQELAGLQSNLLVPVSRAEDVISRQTCFLTLGEPAAMCQLQGGEPHSEERSRCGHVLERTHSQDETLQLDYAERFGDFESERTNVDVLIASGKVELQLLQSRPLAVFLKTLESATEHGAIRRRPALGSD
jgi:hypothetical protein